MRRQRLSRFVDQLWENVDVDGDGHLNPAEFAGFVRMVCNLDHVVESNCVNFLHYMDTSGNGLIEKNELVEFIANGLELDAKAVAEYGSRSETHMLIVQVFEALREKLANPVSRALTLPNIANTTNGAAGASDTKTTRHENNLAAIATANGNVTTNNDQKKKEKEKKTRKKKKNTLGFVTRLFIRLNSTRKGAKSKEGQNQTRQRNAQTAPPHPRRQLLRQRQTTI